MNKLEPSVRNLYAVEDRRIPGRDYMVLARNANEALDFVIVLRYNNGRKFAKYLSAHRLNLFDPNPIIWESGSGT